MISLREYWIFVTFLNLLNGIVILGSVVGSKCNLLLWFSFVTGNNFTLITSYLCLVDLNSLPDREDGYD